mmetsp:Transcript_5175/g.15069  ORF Transcript_5175/g.15069 Transcript_5175/m.15069 type:complete len:233 (-) Transcript_5175:1077-1775(-)
MDSQRDPFSFGGPQTTTKDGKPRSAYDENAEWFCGDDETDVDSIHSDGSSVLSAFRRKKKKKDYGYFENENDAVPEASMNFSALGIGSGGGGDHQPLSSMSIFPQKRTGRDFSIGSNIGMSDESFADLRGSTRSTMSREFDSLESIPVSRLLLVSEKNLKDDDSPAVLSTEDARHRTKVKANALDFIIEAEDEDDKKSLLDKMSTSTGIWVMAVCSTMLFVLDIVLLWLVVK